MAQERREGGRGREREREERDDGMVDKLVHINRVANDAVRQFNQP